MLSEIIKKIIEEKAGLKICDARDCDLLAEKILVDCNCRLSASVLSRLFGFIKGTQNVRAHTLDVIGIFVGYSSYDELVESFNEDRDKIRVTEELRLTSLRKNERIKYSCRPNVSVTFTCLGKNTFRVDSAENSVLKTGDTFQGRVLKIHQPFFVFNIFRDGQKIEKLVEAKISGIDSMVRVEKQY